MKPDNQTTPRLVLRKGRPLDRAWRDRLLRVAPAITPSADGPAAHTAMLAELDVSVLDGNLKVLVVCSDYLKLAS